MEVNGLVCHDLLVNKIKPKFSFNPKKSFAKWQSDLKSKFIELNGIDDIRENKCETNFTVESIEQKDGYKEIKFSFFTEPMVQIPCYLLVPNGDKQKYPVVITLQDHSTGVHNSVGKVEHDKDNIKAYTDYAVQAVKKGYIALAVEQRSQGVTACQNGDFRWCRLNLFKEDGNCYYDAVTSFLMGRTVIGERCSDISFAIDMLKNFPECDMDKLVITGFRIGGETAFYSAVYDERIKGCVPVDAFSSYKDDLLYRNNCSCSYIPSAYKYFDMPDLAGVIAPRKLTVVTDKNYGKKAYNDVVSAFDVVRKIYNKANNALSAKISTTEYNMGWNKQVVWQEIEQIINSL